MDKSTETTHFGYKTVPESEKAKKVADVFHGVAEKYDVMNDVMSLGLHRLWKNTAVELARIRPGQSVLDVAGGSGDLSQRFAKKVGPKGRVILSDINSSMLAQGRDRMIDLGLIGNIDFCLLDAEKLPFPENSFHCISIGFGLRNVTDKQKALAQFYKTLKPGGRCIILEFSKPILPGLNSIYDAYSFSILPQLGKWIADDKDSYQYLAESIRMHPDQKHLKSMMETAGFEQCEYFNLAGGIVAVHRGLKF